MKILLAVDNSHHSERAIAELIRSATPADSTICLFMVVNPFLPPPAMSFLDGVPTHWQIRCRASARLDHLGESLRFSRFPFETCLCETRLPENLAILRQAVNEQADSLVVGVHSVFGIRRRVLEMAFKIIRSRKSEPPKTNPCPAPTDETSAEYQHAA